MNRISCSRLYSGGIRVIVFTLILSTFVCVGNLRAQSLVVSEIHYNPLNALVPADGTNVVDGGEFEFVEVRNIGALPYDLNGVSFISGVTYTFSPYSLAPGDSVVVVENAEYFPIRYPWVTNVAPGQYSGKLSNGGETLILEDDVGSQLFSVDYSDGGEWPRSADGEGRSLMLANLAGDPNNPTSWCASAELHGSPGSTGVCRFTDVVLNEVLSHSDPPLEDAVELYNLSGGPIDLNGWYLSDDFIQPRKFRITNTVINADGHTVFYEYQFNTNALFNTNNIPFALSSMGDELILTAPFPDSERLRLVDMLDFGPTITDISMGRFPDGSGGFANLESLTFGAVNPATVETFRTGEGAPNSAPHIVPIVINEIMYHSSQTNELDLEYVELLNVSDSTFDISGWVLAGVNFTNPPGTFISPGEFLVVCANQTQIFNTYGITNVIGDWPGMLKNGGERIELRTDEGVVIDSVDYNDKEPWPVAADGYGPSLEKFRAMADGDLYLNWGASRSATNWQHVVVTQNVTSAGTGSLKFWLDYEGKCYIDDVSVQPVSGGAELISNGDFELGGTNWNYKGNHEYSRVEQGAGRVGSAALVVVGNFTRIVQSAQVFVSYGDVAGDHIEADSYALAAGNYTVSYWVLRVGPGGNLNALFDGAIHSHQLAHYGTPGTENSVATGLSTLGILDAVSESNVVATGDSNIIRTRLEGSYAGAAVRLYYREVTTNTYQFSDVNYTELSMADDGVTPDLVAGDGDYAATIPAVSIDWTIVRYHVAAMGTNGFTAQSPGVDNPSGDYGYWVQSDPVQTTIPNWHIFSDGAPIVYSNSFRCCAVSPEGDVYTDIRVRHRGRPDTSSPERTGLALRMNQGNLCDTFFAKNQGGINFRHRTNNRDYLYERVVNEYLGYLLQEKIGLATPYNRHTCLWIDGDPTITIELEAPDTDFLELHNLNKGDYISRAGYSGRRIVDGDEELDNFNEVVSELESTTGEVRIAYIQTNLWYESVRYGMALLSVCANADQDFEWNMFQHKDADTGRWTQYPWDVDKSFLDLINSQDMTELHPYYMTPDHPSVWNASTSKPLGETLFYPEDSLYTLPYRYRQQMTLWRYCHTLFTTNTINPILDQLQSDLSPAYTEIGVSTGGLVSKVAEVKNFIEDRRDFLMNGAWSDKDTNIWDNAGVYDPGTVVISEIMYDPLVGGEYLEIYNRGSNTVDLSWWMLYAGEESYRMPHGTMLAPGSWLVVADTQSVLTDTYPELNGSNTIERYPGMPIWDWPIDFLTKAEYSTRVVDMPSLSLPNAGAAIRLYDICSNLIDNVTYSSELPWPATQGAALELVDADFDNSLPAAWLPSFIGGSPAASNDLVLARLPAPTPDPLVFGDVEKDSTNTLTFTISNIGNSVLTVTGLSYPTGFSGNWSGTIAAGTQSPSISVEFIPTAEQSYSGNITINCDNTGGDTSVAVSGTGTGILPATANDFDGDGASDLAVLDQSTGRWFARTVGGTQLAFSVNWGWSGVEGVAGDYDGDGIGDLAVFDQNTGRWFIRSLSGAILAWDVNWGWPGVEPVSGDFDGDGIDDLAVFDQNTGRWFIRSVSGDILAWNVYWGWPGVQPVSGDYDGDGVDDLAILDQNTGRWFVRNLAGDILAWQIYWGWAGVTGVSGDFNGDAKSDLAVFDVLSGRWFIRSVAGDILAWDVNWGWPSVRPVSGDFDGDGVSDLAIFDEASGRWFIRSLAGDTIGWNINWGWPGVQPVGR